MKKNQLTIKAGGGLQLQLDAISIELKLNKSEVVLVALDRLNQEYKEVLENPVKWWYYTKRGGKKISFSLSVLSLRQLNYLVDVLGLNKTETVTVAVDRLYKSEFESHDISPDFSYERRE